MPWFRNHYHCEECNRFWTDEWSCRCDDDCSNCGHPITPEMSEDLHVISIASPVEDNVWFIQAVSAGAIIPH